MKNLRFMAVVLLLMTAAAFGQSTLAQTTLASAAAAGDSAISVASATGISVGNYVVVERETMLVTAINSTILSVTRGYKGQAKAHVSGMALWGGAPGAFLDGDPNGACTASLQPYLPTISLASGRLYNCLNGEWYVDGGIVHLPASACKSSVSGNSSGTNGATTAGTGLVGVEQASTSSTGTNTHTYVCNISIPSYLYGRGAVVTDVVFYYGVQTTGLGTQVATLASGTINSQIVFNYVDFPAAGASETASTVAPVRADSGTLTIAPVVASFNVATTTAGGFYSAKFTPASGIPYPTGAADRRQLLFAVALLNTATSATITNTPGLTVHFAFKPL